MNPVIKPDGSAWVTFSDGCCVQWAQVSPAVQLGSFITEQSTDDVQTEPYEPFILESDPEIYFVPENYDEDMPTPEKFSEQATTLTLTNDTKFVVIKPTGNPEQPYENYNVDYSNMVALITPLIQRPVTVSVLGNRVDIPNLPEITGIGFRNGYLTSDEIVQDANGFETNEGTTWEANQKLILYFT